MSNPPPNDPWSQPPDPDQPPPPGQPFRGDQPSPPPPPPPPPPPGNYPPPGGYPPPPGNYPPPGGYGSQQPSWGGGSYPPPGGNYPPPPPVDPNYQYYQSATGAVLAGWWHRVGATVIDVLVLLIPNILIGLGGGRVGEYAGGAILQFLYISIMLSTRGQTVGNMAVGTRVIDAQTGGPLSGGRAVGRAAAQLLFNALSIIIIPGLLDILWPLWDRDNQTLHDKMAGTVVIRTG